MTEGECDTHLGIILMHRMMSGVGIAHAAAIAAEVADHLRDSVPVQMLRAQMHQRPNDTLAPVRFMARPMAMLLELRHCLGGVGPAGGVQGALELLGGVEVDELDSVGPRAGEECPVVLCPIDDFDQREVRALAEHRLDFGSQPLHQKKHEHTKKNHTLFTISHLSSGPHMGQVPNQYERYTPPNESDGKGQGN